ncbi:unnamed protein product [Paramecium octaurelia]|uniref:WD domain, G-beta repeat protein n=1 Tax=Paramecium octaurelia TaxID=43137 RepID=A0A8S1V982_PAROT|nr:unnamed protein product [Paramecium octaurelia]
MNKNIGIANDVYKQQLQKCNETVQNEIESSFNKIDTYLNQLFNNTSDSFNLHYERISQRQSALPILNISENTFNNLNFANQLCQDISSLIKPNINKQIKLNDKSLNEDKKQKHQDEHVQLNQQVQSIINQSDVKKFTYQIITDYSISQSNWCCAIAINKDCSILLIACNSQIKVFEFHQGITKQTQILSQHKDRVFTLNFMQKSNQFISGSEDHSIIIWQYNSVNQWISQQILYGHISYIWCLILNNNEDLIVSGSSDKSIRFWIKKNEWMCQQTITDHSNCVCGLSLNQQQNRIISCGFDKQILIMEEQGQNKQWIVIQKITVEQYGYRVCFIDNNMFIFSQYGKEQISIFEMNSINQQFEQTRDINVKCGLYDYCLFAQQYINLKCILMSKNGQYVNLIRKQQNGQFVTEQSIHFDTNYIYGRMSDDGQYLVTWDDKSEQIQIRRYKEQ